MTQTLALRLTLTLVNTDDADIALVLTLRQLSSNVDLGLWEIVAEYQMDGFVWLCDVLPRSDIFKAHCVDFDAHNRFCTHCCPNLDARFVERIGNSSERIRDRQRATVSRLRRDGRGRSGSERCA